MKRFNPDEPTFHILCGILAISWPLGVFAAWNLFALPVWLLVILIVFALIQSSGMAHASLFEAWRKA
jgi:hypothetical protein